MSIRRGWILCAAVLGFGAWITTPAPGETNDYYGYQQLGTRCVVTETSLGELIVAETSWRVWSDRQSPDGYRWQARLIPAQPGLNLGRPWSEVEVEDVGTGASSYDGTVTTPPVSANLDWDLQLKLTWDRSNQPDTNVEHVLEFNERSCLGA
jgi:hypothetical protein